ncbi:hypothetical protein ABT275_42325 [Streptomyces sp. NPDC001185]|uniref:hypothetical protein n=1 Tax=Streptomyces sp. NPDC001185 TaxID=3154380 RepID=UPI00331ED92E
MIKIALRGLTAAALLTVPLTTTAAADPARHVASMPLTAAVDLLPIAAESRDGYQRAAFKHWVDADRDSCNTRVICTLKSGWSAMPLVHMDLSAVVVLRHVRHRERKRVARIIPLSSGLSPGRYSLRP